MRSAGPTGRARAESVWSQRSGPLCTLFISACLGLSSLATLGCGPTETREAAPRKGPSPATVEVTVVLPRLLIDTVALTGQLEAEHAVLIKPEQDGLVESIPLREGQPMAKGEVLIRLRDDVQRARVDEAQAEVRLSQQIFDRERKLARRDAGSLAKIEEARARLDTSRARLVLAEIALDRTQIRAPFDGVAGALLVAPGARVEDRTELVPFTSIDRLQVIFSVTENAIALARVGGKIHVRVAAWPGERFPGEVFFVSPTVDPAARRLIMKAWVANADHRLKPGMFTNVDVQIASREDALIVPEAAMVYDRNGIYVWRVDSDNRVEKVPVRIGLRQRGTVEIVDGLSSGDAVISAGTHKVMAGREVRIVETPASSAPPSQDASASGGQAS